MPDQVLILDSEGTILYINYVVDSASVESVVGVRATDLMSPDSALAHNKALHHTLKKGEPSELEFSSNYGRTYRCRLIPLDDGVMSVATDTTEQMRMEQLLQKSEERYRAVFELAADSIVLIDVETGAILEFNDKAHKNLGYTREEFQELGIPDFEILESPK